LHDPLDGQYYGLMENPLKPAALLLILSCTDSPATVDCSLAPGEGVAEIETMVADVSACPAEALVLRRVVTLGEESGPNELTHAPQAIATDSRGRYFLLGSNQGIEVPKIFSPNGEFLTNLSRIGDGPGEFKFPSALLIDPSDSVFVLDGSARRMTVWTPQLQMARTSRIEYRLQSTSAPAVLMTGGRIATNMDTRQGHSLGPVLQILTPDGAILHAFAEEARTFTRWVDSWWAMKTLGPSRDGFWSGTMAFEYRVEKWDSGGRLVRRLLRRPSWFLPYDTLTAATPERAPTPYLMRVREDANGLLWTTLQVADSQWAEGFDSNPVRGEGGVMHYRVRDAEKVLDSYIEVIDPRSGQLVLSRRFDGRFSYLINDSLVGKSIELANGAPAVEVYQVIPPWKQPIPSH
jgi:hypothetical protein